MINNKQTVIIKFGSESLTDASGLLSQSRIDTHVKNIMRVAAERKVNVVIVSSGAVAAGREYCQESLRKAVEDISQQTLAAIGNPIMANAWSVAFRSFGLASGLILVTNHEILDKAEGLAIQKTYASLKADDAVAIYNSNDAIEHDELDKLAYGGDNDWLAAHLAVKLDAQALLFATNVDGFMTKDGAVQSIVKGSDIEGLTEHFFEESNSGTGGIQSKLGAAHFVAQAGVGAFIGSSNADYVQILAGQIGTRVIQ